MFILWPDFLTSFFKISFLFTAFQELEKHMLVVKSARRSEVLWHRKSYMGLWLPWPWERLVYYIPALKCDVIVPFFSICTISQEKILDYVFGNE